MSVQEQLPQQQASSVQQGDIPASSCEPLEGVVSDAETTKKASPSPEAQQQQRRRVRASDSSDELVINEDDEDEEDNDDARQQASPKDTTTATMKHQGNNNNKRPRQQQPEEEESSGGGARPPWKMMVVWSERYATKEPEFLELLQRVNRQDYVLPWKRTAAGGNNKKKAPNSGEMLRAVGNTNRVLFLQLMTYHFTGKAEVEFRDDEREGFFGIWRVRIPAEHRAQFDAEAIPSVSSLQAALRRGGSSQPHHHQAMMHIKATQRIWNAAGFVERVSKVGARRKSVAFFFF